MGSKKIFLDRLVYVAAFFQLPASARCSRLTMLEAVEYGWWYAARLPNERVAVAVACDPDFMKRAALNKSDNWRAHLKETVHLSRVLAGCVFVEDSLLACTAPSLLLDNATGHRWLAVGDAASSYDPISSQGIFKALSDGLHAAEIIAAFVRGGADRFGDYQSAIASSFDSYLANRNFFYAVEKRWSGSPFWKRRMERTALN